MDASEECVELYEKIVSNEKDNSCKTHMKAAQHVSNDVVNLLVVEVQVGTGNRSAVAGATRSYAEAVSGECSSKP